MTKRTKTRQAGKLLQEIKTSIKKNPGILKKKSDLITQERSSELWDQLAAMVANHPKGNALTPLDLSLTIHEITADSREIFILGTMAATMAMNSFIEKGETTH